VGTHARYHGPRAFSEPESRVIKSLAEEVELDGDTIIRTLKVISCTLKVIISTLTAIISTLKGIIISTLKGIIISTLKVIIITLGSFVTLT
jgi:hypothetical protein